MLFGFSLFYDLVFKTNFFEVPKLSLYLLVFCFFYYYVIRKIFLNIRRAPKLEYDL